MTISLRENEYGYTSFNDKEVSVYLNNDNFVDWLDMNWEYISQAVEDFCHNDAWCCGGAFEVELDILQIYQNAPYDLKQSIVKHILKLKKNHSFFGLTECFSPLKK